MSLTTEGMTPADIYACTRGGNNDGTGFGGDGWWILLLLLFAGGGFGNGFGGGNGNMLYPWMNQAEITSDGFRDQMLNSNVTSIRDGINNIQTQLCNGFSDVQMSTMNSAFGLQNAINSGVNGLQAQLAQCCCENRLASADLKYTIATENCADRQALSESTMSIIANQTASTQRILDQLCQDKIDAKNDEISQLRQEVLYARGQASQIAQNTAIVNGIYDRLNNCPVGTVPVYGEQPIFTCPNSQNSCGCGCNV